MGDLQGLRCPHQNKQEVGTLLRYTQILYESKMTNFSDSQLVKIGDCDPMRRAFGQMVMHGLWRSGYVLKKGTL